MSQRRLILLALALAAVTTAGSAAACPSASARLTPAGGEALPVAGAAVSVDGADWRFDGVEERGPVLWSEADVVELKVTEHTAGHVVLVAARPLVAGTTYRLAYTRDGTGHGLDRPVAPLRAGVWVASGSLVASPCPTTSGCCTGGALWQRLALFGFLPFGLSYLGATALIGHRRRRAIERL